MRDETYKIAYEEALAELRDIVIQYEVLRLRKERIEHVVTALRPFIGMDSVPGAPVVLSTPDPVREAVSEPVSYSYLQAGEQSQGAARSESERITAKLRSGQESVAEPVAFASDSSLDPFQRRIDDALWGWRRPATVMSTS
jgi:hypothetical protein